jgi:hypothetical protein
LIELEPEWVDVSPAGAHKRLVYPKEGTFQLDDSSGTEFVFLCGNRGRRPQAEEVEAALRKVLEPGKNPKLPSDVVIVMTRDRLEVIAGRSDEQTRGHRMVGADSIGRAEDRFNAVRRLFVERFEFFAGAAFPHD